MSCCLGDVAKRVDNASNTCALCIVWSLNAKAGEYTLLDVTDYSISYAKTNQPIWCGDEDIACESWPANAIYNVGDIVVYRESGCIFVGRVYAVSGSLTTFYIQQDYDCENVAQVEARNILRPAGSVLQNLFRNRWNKNLAEEMQRKTELLKLRMI